MKNSTSFYDRISFFLFCTLLLVCACYGNAQTYSPFMALGNAQFFDNNGEALTAGVLYSYQAGTTTQQATFTDSTGGTMNPDPIPFGSGARVSIWLTSNLTYKFVLCLQNDGAFCAPADVLFSVDHVPGCPGCASSGSPYIGTFISGSPNPATTGILELASTDGICWRNTAGTTNLCITKDSSDILTWSGGTIKLPELGCSAMASGFDYLCPNSALHRFSISNNNTTYATVPTVPAAGLENHLAGFTATGWDLFDSGATAPLTTAVTFSATPTFTAASQDQLFTLTLTGNVTSSTLVMTGLPVPSLVSFELTEDATGGRTFVWPPNVFGPTSIASTPNSVTFVQFLWDGTNAREIGPSASPSFNPPQRTTLVSPLSVPSSVQTVVLTQAVTFPSAAGTYRADSRYGMWVTAGSNVCAALVVDTTNNLSFAFSGQDANGSGYIGLSGAEISSNTYAAGATATFTLQIACNSSTSVTVNSGIFGLSPAPVTYLSVTPVLSN